MTNKETQTEILEALGRIERGLYGDKENDQKGVVERLAEAEEYIEADRKMKQKVGGAVWVIGAVWTALTGFISYAMQKFL